MSNAVSNSIPSQEIRSASLHGRIDLLDRDGDVVSSWGVPLGRCTIGASPDCTIRILQDGVEPVHAILTVGKKYTLLKAVGPCSVGYRAIKEWLFDQSSLVVVGNQAIVIHPNASVSVSVVTSERLSEIAARLSAFDGSSRAASHREPNDSPSQVAADVAVADTSTIEMLTELRRSVDAIAETVEALKNPSNPLPTVEELYEQIESAAADSARIASESTLHRIGEPWFAEIRNELRGNQDEQRTSLVALQESCEGRLVELEHQVHQSGEWSKDEVERLTLQLAELRTEQQSVRDELQHLEEIQHALSETVLRIASAPSLPQSNVGAETDSSVDAEDRVEPDAFQSAFSEPSQAPSNYEGSDRFDELVAVDSELEYKFPIDDEPINQRLERMLFEASDRRPSPNVDSGQGIPSDSFRDQGALDAESLYASLPEYSDAEYGSAEYGEAQYSEAQYSEAQYSEAQYSEVDPGPSGAIVTDGEYETYEREETSASEDSIAFDDELVPRLSDRYETEESVRGPVGIELQTPISAEDLAIPGMMPAAAAVDNEIPSAVSGESSTAPESSMNEDDSIEEYMQKLLMRVRTGPNASGIESPVSPIVSKRPVESKDRNLSSRSLSSVTQPPLSRMRPAAESLGPAPARPTQEVKSDLEALREIANSNARRAINQSVIRRKSSNVIVKVAVVVISLVCAMAMLMMNGARFNATLLAIIAAVLIAILWGVDSVREVRSLLVEQKLRSGSDKESETTDPTV